MTFDLDLRMFICLGVFCHHALEFLLQLITLVFEFIERAAPFFGDVPPSKSNSLQTVRISLKMEEISFCMEDTKAAIVL